MKKLIAFVVGMSIGVLFISGCLWADATTKSTLRASAAVIAEMNDRCQKSNDCNSCKEGLKRASKNATSTATLANGGK
jgi:hypothetical protein